MASPLRRLFVPVYLPTALEFAGESAFLPILPFIAIDLGFQASEAAALGLIGGVLSVLGTAPIGRLMMKLGERTTILGSGALLIVVNCALAALVADGLPVHGSVWHRCGLVAALVAISTCIIVWSLGRQAYLGTYLPPEIRARGMTTLGGAMRVGQICGPLLSTVVLWIGSSAWVFVLYAALMVVASYCVWSRMLETDGGAAASRAETSNHREPSTVTGALGRTLTFHDMLRVAIGVIPLGMARVNRPVIVPLMAVAMGLEEHDTTLLFGISAVLEILLFYPAGVIMDRWGRRAAIVPCMIILGLGFALAGPFSLIDFGADGTRLPFLLLLAASIVMALGNGLGSGVMMTLGVDMSNSATRTKDLARWNTLMGAGRLAAPLVVTSVTALAPVGWAAVIMAAMLGAGGAWLWKVLPQYSPGTAAT